MKIINEAPQDTHLSSMKDGELAVITNWTYPAAIGTIVQRFGIDLLALGKCDSSSWPQIFSANLDTNVMKKCRVRILSVGTRFEI